MAKKSQRKRSSRSKVEQFQAGEQRRTGTEARQKAAGEPSQSSRSALEQFQPEPPDSAQAFEAAALALEEDNELVQAQAELEDRLGLGTVFAEAAAFTAHDERLGLTNIRGTAIGEKQTAGKFTGSMAVKVYVVEKAAASRLDAGAVPESVNGIPTDVEEVGDIDAFGYRERQRPAPCGSSVGHPDITAGTIGCLCVRDGRLCLLSNNHVIADENEAQIGDRIIQPGRADGGDPRNDVIGALEDFVAIQFGGSNRVDAALALTNFDFASPSHHSFTINTSPARAYRYMMVKKDGRTTGYTVGMITALNANVNVGYGAGVAHFRGQLEIQGFRGPFSLGGDSGSLIVEAISNRPVGLLFAGTRTGSHTWANPISEVTSALRIDRFLNQVE